MKIHKKVPNLEYQGIQINNSEQYGNENVNLIHKSDH